MIVIAAVLLVVLGASVLGLRTAGGGPRWPFLVASTLSGGCHSCPGHGDGDRLDRWKGHVERLGERLPVL
jgi:hypothetical protein